MTATGAAGLGKGRTAVDVLAALFPCGSVTGAPKIRAMELIAAIEKEPRGVYTGSIGWVGPGGDAGFNVAIRTLVIPEEPGPARLRDRSTVVADSTAHAECRDSLAKRATAGSGTIHISLIATKPV